jgi:hypothetical protein
MGGVRQMRYQRGVPLTGEERAGGGQGAGRGWQNPGGGGYGFNPNVNTPQTDQGWQSEGNQLLQQLGGGGQYNLGQIMQAIMSQQPQENLSESLTTRKMLQDPVGYYNKMASLPSNAPGSLSAFAPGGLFEGRMAADTMTPAQIMASQGMTAKNQWASQMPAGSTTESGVDTDELRKLNQAQRGRYKTYM